MMNPENWYLGNVPLNNDFSIIESLVLAPTTNDQLAALHDRIRAKQHNIYTISDLCRQRYPLPTIILEIQQSCVNGIEKYMLDLSVDQFFHQLDKVRDEAARERHQISALIKRLEMENAFCFEQFKHVVRTFCTRLVAEQHIARLVGYSEVVRQLDQDAQPPANRCTPWVPETETETGESGYRTKISTNTLADVELFDHRQSWLNSGEAIEQSAFTLFSSGDSAWSAESGNHESFMPTDVPAAKPVPPVARGGDHNDDIQPIQTAVGRKRHIKLAKRPEPQTPSEKSSPSPRRPHRHNIRLWSFGSDTNSYGGSPSIRQALARRVARFFGATEATSTSDASDDGVTELFQTLGISENHEEIWQRPETRQGQLEKLKAETPTKSKSAK